MNYTIWSSLDKLKNSNRLAEWFLKHYDEVISKSYPMPKMADMIMSPISGAMALRGDYPIQVEPELSSQWTRKDLRIEYLLVKGYRGLPYIETGDIESGAGNRDEKYEYYGLSLSGNDVCNLNYHTDISDTQIINSDSIPTSFIILGENGSGKTTLYSALELVSLGRTSIERKHKIVDEAEIRKFRHHLGEVDKPLEIMLGVVDKEVKASYSDKIDNPQTGVSLKENIDLQPFFCSESDLSILECSGTQMDDYLMETIGIKDLNDFIGVVENLEKELEERFLAIKSSEDSANARSETEMLVSHLNSQVSDLKECLLSEKEDLSVAIFKDCHKIISNILSDYLENDEVELDYRLSGTDVPIFTGMLRKKSNPDVKINPRYYFNNFRLKLYMVCLRVSIAFYIMRTRKVNFPLVFDDIFDSSDFHNRVESETFFCKLVSQYYDLRISDKPLQILFFTQDDIIADCVYKGIVKVNNITGLDNNTASFGVLFHFDETDTSDLVVIKSESGNSTDVSGEKKLISEIKFRNLLDPIKQR